MHGLVSEWYFSGDLSANSWDIYGVPGNTIYQETGFEGFTNSVGYATSTFSLVTATTAYLVDLPATRFDGGLALPANLTTSAYNADAGDSTILCANVGTPINLPATPTVNAPANTKNSAGGQVLTFRAWGTNSTCVISGNGHTIEGSGGTYTLNAPQTVTLQWAAYDGDWRIISRPPGQLPIYTVSTLPTCGASQLGLLYAVSDATSPTYNSALTGGGAVKIPVFCNGSAWTAH
jgi:hypothetical protein